MQTRNNVSLAMTGNPGSTLVRSIAALNHPYKWVYMGNGRLVRILEYRAGHCQDNPHSIGHKIGKIIF